MQQRTFALEIIALGAVLAVTEIFPPPEEVVFGVEPGSATKTFEVQSSMTTEESVLVLGEMGEHNPAEGMVRDSVSTFRVADECLAAEQGRQLPRADDHPHRDQP